ncbi:MAG TPA: cation:proton antiporter [Pseudonocardiaceae bacterium]|jgi:Kef-type K+ transport system membrane component KefB
MTAPVDVILTAVHVLVAASVALAMAAAGGLIARRIRQDAVIGEIAVGLLFAPVVLWLGGHGTLHWLVPPAILSGLKFLGNVGLIFFLVSVTHELGQRGSGPDRRTVGWLAGGAFVVPLVLGALLGGFLVRYAAPGVRGHAPGLALVLFIAVSMAITAMPVLARILADRGIERTSLGQRALSAAIVQDAAGWLVLSVAIGADTGSVAGFVRVAITVVVGVLVAFGLRRPLGTRTLSGFAQRRIGVTASVIAVVALGVAFWVQSLGLTVIFGAALAGLALPRSTVSAWNGPVERVGRWGRRLAPLFFLVTGITVFASTLSAVPWPLVVVVCVLGAAGKTLGGYLGARLGRTDQWSALRFGALMNTRGLTELAVLQVGFSGGLITAPVFLAFVIMALVTSVSTGPLLKLIDWRQDRGGLTAPVIGHPLSARRGR